MSPSNREVALGWNLGGTGRILLEAIDFVIKQYDMDKDQKRYLKSGFVRGWELFPNTAHLCVMNLFLHGVDGDPCPIKAGADSLAGDPGERFGLILANPPFGKKTSERQEDFRSVGPLKEGERQPQPKLKDWYYGQFRMMGFPTWLKPGKSRFCFFTKCPMSRRNRSAQ